MLLANEYFLRTLSQMKLLTRLSLRKLVLGAGRPIGTAVLPLDSRLFLKTASEIWCFEHTRLHYDRLRLRMTRCYLPVAMATFAWILRRSGRLRNATQTTPSVGTPLPTFKPMSHCSGIIYKSRSSDIVRDLFLLCTTVPLIVQKTLRRYVSMRACV